MEMEEEEIGIPEWVVTFGDMMSLLLTFFIMLVSMSEIKEEERYQAMVESLRQQFGYDKSMMSMAPGKAKPRNSAVAKIAAQGRANRFDTTQGGDKVKAPSGDFPRVRVVSPGKKTGIGTVIHYLEGDPDLSDSNKHDLEIEADEMRGKPQKIAVRGHTSLRPRAGGKKFRENWELGYTRARSVMEYLVNELGINPRRIEITSAGPNEPLHVGSDPLQLKLNPRVEVYMLDQVVEGLSGGDAKRRERFFESTAP